MNEQPGSLSLDLQECAELKRRFTGGRPYSDRISMGFLCRLLILYTTNGEHIEVLSALDQLEGLPSGCRTKRPTRFKGEILGRFWHKHFSTSRHVIRNIGEEWGFSRGGNKKLDKIIAKIAETDGNDPNVWPGALAYKLGMGGYQRRSAVREMTGDWIVFGKQQGKNYYLDLATHAEPEEPARLYEKLRGGSEAEFPFLFA